MEIVIAVDSYGFDLSRLAYQRLLGLGIPLVDDLRNTSEDIYVAQFGTSLSGQKIFHSNIEKEENRNNPLLVQVVKELGKDVSEHSTLKIVTVPDGVDWEIACPDGVGWEWVQEKHRTWG